MRWREADGIQRRQTFTTKRDAMQFDAMRRADTTRGQWVDPQRGRVTFKAWAEEWLSGDPVKRNRTRYDDAGILRNHINPVLGDRPIAKVTQLDVRRLVAKWTADAAPSSVRRRYAVLRAALNAAVDADVIGRSPCRGVRLPVIEPQARRIVTPAEMSRITDNIDPEYRALVRNQRPAIAPWRSPASSSTSWPSTWRG